MTTAATPTRPALSWIKRRARRIQRFYQVPRRMAIWDAIVDHATFFNPPSAPVLSAARPGLLLIQGGVHARD